MQVPATALALLKLREGFRTKPYKDTLGKWTVGCGHLMSKADIDRFGLKQPIPQNVLDEWLASDAMAAYRAALQQAEHMKVSDSRFIDVLTSVNFQLGTAWTRKFPNTWKALVERRYDVAIANLQASAWMRQTPVRVKEFQEAIRRLKGGDGP